MAAFRAPMIPATPSPARRRGAWAVLAVLAAAHLAVSWWGVVPGHLSIDEGTYHFMVANLAEGRAFWIWNGYPETPSPELVAATLLPIEDRLVAVPPELFTLLALPFYLLLGYRGLFAINALAFLGTAALVGWLAARLGGRAAMLPAVLLFALGTFAWDYSQAAWPHAVSALLVTAAFAAAVLAGDRSDGPRALGWALAAGLAGGVAVGVRVDSVLALPALVLPLVFARRPRWRLAAAVAAGALPALAGMAAINQVKFGTWSPLSYGPVGPAGTIGRYLPMALAGAAALAAAWALTRPAVRAWLTGRRAAAAAAGMTLLAAAAALAVPEVRRLAWVAAHGAWQLVVDLRARPLDVAEPALSRTPSGAMVYLGSLKKSLLQSCPWMAALAVPLASATRRRAALLLALVPAAYLAFYSFSAWHGGLSLNLRYWVPALPFLAAIGGLAWCELSAAAGTAGRRVAAAIGAALALLYLGVLRPAATTLAAAEAVYLSLPLALAAAALLLAAARRALEERSSQLLAAAAAAAFAAGAVWAGLVAFTYDWPRHTALRAANLRTSQRIAPVVAADSILFARYPDPYFGLIEVPRLRLAIPGRDRFADFRRLVDVHLAAGRPVYASFDPDLWRRLAADGMLDGLAARPLLPDGLVVELFPAASPAAQPGARSKTN